MKKLSLLMILCSLLACNEVSNVKTVNNKDKLSFTLLAFATLDGENEVWDTTATSREIYLLLPKESKFTEEEIDKYICVHYTPFSGGFDNLFVYVLQTTDQTNVSGLSAYKRTLGNYSVFDDLFALYIFNNSRNEKQKTLRSTDRVPLECN